MMISHHEQYKFQFVNIQQMSSQYERYGDYILNRKEPLGSGKFGTVWRGYRIVKTQKQEFLEAVAIKQSVYDQQNIQQINTLQILSHPNIIRYIDYRMSGNSLFMVMELCEGGTLEDLLMTFRLDEDLTSQVLYYYSQIVRGIKFMYEKNILHRDLKPSNILIKDGKIKIADFGTSKLKEENEMIRTLVGTPLFASPEILQLFAGDQQSYTQKSDIWSLGLILYFMFHYQRDEESPLQRLKESLPWKGKSPMQVLHNIRTKPLQFKCPSMPEQIKDILTRMLTIDVNARMSFKEFLQIKLFQTERPKKIFSPVKTQSMEQSGVCLQLSQSFTYEQYELTLINENTHQPQFLKRETIDFQLLKMLEMRDSEDYEDKQVADALKFYEIIREQAEQADSKEDYSELIFEIDCQIYQLSLIKRFLCRKLTLSQRGIRKSQNNVNVEYIQSLFNRDEQPTNEAEAHLYRNCCSIYEKHFAFSKRFDGLNATLKTIFLEFTQNDNIAQKAKLLMKVISPLESLNQETKRILKKKKGLFEDPHTKAEALMSRMEICLIYELLNVIAFDYCWKILANEKRKIGSKSSDFIDNYRAERSKIHISQFVKRIESTYKQIKL